MVKKSIATLEDVSLADYHIGIVGVAANPAAVVERVEEGEAGKNNRGEAGSHRLRVAACEK
jgi:hypothetical protein